MLLEMINRQVKKVLPAALCVSAGLFVHEAAAQATGSAKSHEWEVKIPVTAFVKIDTLSGKNSDNYYSIQKEAAGEPFIHAHYLPPGGPTRLGCRLSDTLTDATTITWQWRVHLPPQGADERVAKKNDSGAAIYLLFKNGFQTQIIKYVFSTQLPQGTVMRKDPLYPFQRMYVVVSDSWNEKEKDVWKKVTVNIKEDFMRLYGTKTCPPVLGIGIMSDGDETKSEVIADYGRFTLSGTKN